MARALPAPFLAALCLLVLAACSGSAVDDATPVEGDMATVADATPEATETPVAATPEKPVETPEDRETGLPPEERTTVYFVHTDW